MVCKINIPIILSYICVLMLTACVNTSNQNKNYCLINKYDDLKYFDFFNKKLSLLKIPEDSNIVTLISLSSDYNIPVFNSELLDEHKMNVKPNIYPPIIYQDYP